MSKIGITNLEDEDSFVGTLMALVGQKKFRTAWTFLETNVDPENIRVHDAGILLQNLSNEFGDIGNLSDECILKKNLEVQASTVIKLLK